MADERRSRKPRQSAGAAVSHPLEWLIGGISGLMIVCLLAYLGYRAISADGRPPEFTIKVEKIEGVGDHFHVNIAVTNPGEETAAGLIVQARLGAGEQAIETSEIQFDYLPAGSTRRGAIIFRNDPSRAGDLQLFVLGYTDP